MKDITLPGARAALVGAGGLTDPAFYRWMQSIDQNVATNTGNGEDTSAEIKAIALKLGSVDGSVQNIPPQGVDAVINGGGSIEVDGTLQNGVVNITLMYDTLLPGPTTYYGADSAGKRGWFPVSAALADSATIDVTTDAGTGISSFNLIGFGSLTTDALAEGVVHLYFTSARVNASLVAGDGISLTFAGGLTTISLVGLPIYIVSQAGDQMTDQAGNMLVSSQTTGLPISWTDVLGTPTTLAGYGITDAQKVGDPVSLPPYTLGTMPSAATNIYRMIYVTDITSGAEPCVSDGTNWRKFSDRSIAS